MSQSAGNTQNYRVLVPQRTLDLSQVNPDEEEVFEVTFKMVVKRDRIMNIPAPVNLVTGIHFNMNVVSDYGNLTYRVVDPNPVNVIEE